MSFRLLPEEAQQPAPQPEQSTLQKIGSAVAEQARPYARVGTNLVGLATGLPGDIASLLNDWVAGPAASLITGEKAVPYEKTPIGKILPTSQQTTASLRSLAPEYLSPRNAIEDFTDTVINDAALLLTPNKAKIPFAGTVSKGRKLFQAFATSLGANAAGKAVEDWTGGDVEKGAYTKIGSLLALSLLNKPKAAQIASNMYKEAEAALPSGALTDASKLESNLNALKSKMQKGTIAPSEKFVIDEVDAVLNKVKNGEISVEEAWASKRSLNEKLNDYLFKNPEKAAQARARKLAKGIQHELSSTIHEYGKTNPKFLENFKNAEEAFGTIAQSKWISNFFRKHVKHFSPSDSGLAHLFGSAAGSAVGGTAVGLLGGAAPAIGVGSAVYPAAQIAYRVSKSPVLRKHYLNALNAAAREDAVVFKKEYDAMKAALEKEEKKDTYRLVD